MTKYNVTLSAKIYACIQVEAESAEHAVQIARDQENDGIVPWDDRASSDSVSIESVKVA